MSRYELLCGLAVEHQFFSRGDGPAFDFAPTAETAHVLNRIGLVVKDEPAGIRVFADELQRDALRHATASEPIALTFIVRARDPLFQYITAPPVQRHDRVLFFESAAGQPATANPVLLHDGAVAGDRDFRALPFVKQRAGVPPQREWAPRPDFVVSLRIGGDRAVQYGIRFDARRTVWKYYLLGPAASRAPLIVEAGGQIDFELVGHESLPGRAPALVYRSRTPIALRDRYDFKLQLRDSVERGGRVIIRRLPAPAVHQFGKDSIDGQDTIVSEIFVNS